MPNRSVLNVGKRKLVAKTCTACGLFKDASEFRISNKGYYDPGCKRCQHISAKKHDKKTESESLATAHRHRDPWSDDEIKMMKKLLGEGLKIREVAAKLERSYSSITQAKYKYLQKEDTDDRSDD